MTRTTSDPSPASRRRPSHCTDFLQTGRLGNRNHHEATAISNGVMAQPADPGEIRFKMSALGRMQTSPHINTPRWSRPVRRVSTKHVRTIRDVFQLKCGLRVNAAAARTLRRLAAST
jgi:hypothetical protein